MSLLNFTTILISLSLNLFNTHESVEWKFFFVSNINEQHFQCWKTYGTGNPFVKEFFLNGYSKSSNNKLCRTSSIY